MIQPAAALAEGHRFVVGLRGLVHTDGSDVEPSEGLAAQLAEPDALTSALVADLEAAGVDPDDPWLWIWEAGSASYRRAREF